MISLIISSLVAIFVIFIISYIYIGKYTYFVKKKFIQPLLEDGPSHSKKKGTPTTGGVSVIALYTIIILFLTIISKFFDLDINFYTISIILITVLGYFFIGLIDDMSKIKYHNNEKGLSVKQKFGFQVLVSLVLIAIFIAFNNHTTIILYAFNKTIDIGYAYYILIPFLLVATTNATNLTDGLDGLLTTNAIISITALTIIAILSRNATIVISNIVIIAILIAFLFYNKYPAKIFLGDVGSLSIGAYIVIEAILLKIEILFFMFVFIYFIETLSVIFQVGYYKFTKRRTGEGKRIFLMAPYHHHLEKKGLNENKIVFLFGIINIVFCIIGIIIYILGGN